MRELGENRERERERFPIKLLTFQELFSNYAEIALYETK